ncbi:MAG: aminopeptidase P family protein [Anaerolineales bacterium]|nr:aminopeptidase P family protein [Anaerolineales bacterium]
MEAIYQERIGNIQQSLLEKNLDYMFLTVSPDLVYLTGYTTYTSERLRLLTIPQEGKPTFIFPDYERDAICDLDWIDILGWFETDDPFSLVVQAISTKNDKPIRIAISDQTPAGFLLRLMDELPGACFVPASEIIVPMSRIKSGQEISILKKGQDLATESLKQLFNTPFAGRSEKQVAAELFRICENAGLEAGVAQVGSGPNSARFIDPTERIIQAGDAVLIDFCTTYQGYWTDCTRTVHVGSPTDEFRRVYEIVREANHTALAAVRPFVSCESIDRAARRVINVAGYGDYFVHRTGHGIGIEMHEEPWIVKGNDKLLEPGMVLTIEPGIYFPDAFGYRLEDVIVVEKSGGQSITHLSHDIIIVK